MDGRPRVCHPECRDRQKANVVLNGEASTGHLADRIQSIRGRLWRPRSFRGPALSRQSVYFFENSTVGRYFVTNMLPMLPNPPPGGPDRYWNQTDGDMLTLIG